MVLAKGSCSCPRRSVLQSEHRSAASELRAYARTYTDLKYGPNQKIEPASNSHIVWSLLANGFMGEAADNISTPHFEYVYNYLFEPEKVKGIAYTPLS